MLLVYWNTQQILIEALHNNENESPSLAWKIIIKANEIAEYLTSEKLNETKTLTLKIMQSF